MTSLRLGTRRSALATTQSGHVADALRAAGHDVELVEIVTEGDTNRASLASLGGTGVFASALREALKSGEIDLAVHSLKDLPTAPEPGLVVVAIPPRVDPRDALCARDGLTLGELGEGAVVENHWIPVGRVGLYVPGGRAVYPSSVVMNVVPAQAAGVGSLAVTSPPQRDHGGLPHPTVLAACALLGVDEVYAAGGAQAVAMLAHGVQDDDGGWLCAPVDLVTGPGNVYVAAAKRALQGVIGVDAEAGPSEIAVIADGTARADWVAADLISQAEHDPLAASVLITDSEDLVRDVLAAIEAQVPGAFHEDQIREALTGPQSGVLLVRDMDQAVEVSDRYATEHLEIQTRDPEALVGRIRNAGAVFVGPHAPVPLGDYSAGSNHVLPTSGTARFSSGLNTVTFLRLQQRIRYTETGLKEVADGIGVLAEDERLPAHGAAIRARFA